MLEAFSPNYLDFGRGVDLNLTDATDCCPYWSKAAGNLVDTITKVVSILVPTTNGKHIKDLVKDA
ncbi:hypothetical protein [Streptococcus hyointestinalis]|uniref:hypothetical protein n=1 Tax=Streptococcus hyointestinalis TaxID=1337 RepID=UPI0013E0A073|nr:hypothetical protein [Streptococcus hyointestinalis]